MRSVLNTRVGQNVAVLVVVLVTVFAAFQSQRAVNHDKATQERLDQTLLCIKNYNVHQGQALAARDEVVASTIKAEITLWARYNQLFEEASANPAKVAELQVELNDAIRKYRIALEETQQNRLSYPYAKPDVLADC